MLICKEPALPYDRIKLSKALKSSAENLQLRPREFYSEQVANIETLLGVEAIQVNVEDKKVILDEAESIPYDYLVLASGGTPRELNIPGHDLNGIYQLRSVFDANKIAEVAKDKNVVVIGSSFIGKVYIIFKSRVSTFENSLESNGSNARRFFICCHVFSKWSETKALRNFEKSSPSEMAKF